MARKPDFTMGYSSPASVVGTPPGNPATDGVDLIDGGLEQIDGEGAQSGSHPAKTQGKILRYFE